jgi:preprotein translocase subunit SecB
MSQIGDKYFVSISVSIFNENLSVDSPFYLFISLTGEFQFTDNADVDNEFMIDMNAVAILFPYLRSAVTNITSTANIPPLILPTINVSKLLL